MEEPALTVILPCAGAGSRLGLSGPKELYEVEAGIPMIQYALDPILKCCERLGRIRIAVVIREGKKAVFEYVEQQFLGSSVEVVSVDFDPSLREWPGSIYSTRHVFSEKNIVLLPDSFVHCPGSNVLNSMMNRLERNRLVFGAKPTTDAAEICRLGALQLHGERSVVVGFQDKPDAADGYNAIWGCLGFHQEIAVELHEFLMASVDHGKDHYGERSFYPAEAFEIENYFDLGTWPRIETFREWKRIQSTHGVSG